MVGIGALYTSPARRGRGGATRLVERLLERAEAEGYEYALLFSEIDRAFYERLGFVPLPLVESRLHLARRAGAPAVLVRAGFDGDVPAVTQMGAVRAAGARFALDRGEDWIRFGLAKHRLLAGLGPPGLRQVEFLVVEEAHRAVAYVVTSVEGGRWFIEDAGDRDPSGARLGALLQVMLARTPHTAPLEIRAWLPYGFLPPQAAIVESRPTSPVLMLRPLADRTLPLPPLDANDVVYWRSDYF
jgi:hypothetical protein